MANVGSLHLLAEVGEKVEVSCGRPLGLVGIARRFEDAHLLLVPGFVGQRLLVERFPKRERLGKENWKNPLIISSRTSDIHRFFHSEGQASQSERCVLSYYTAYFSFHSFHVCEIGTGRRTKHLKTERRCGQCTLCPNPWRAISPRPPSPNLRSWSISLELSIGLSDGRGSKDKRKWRVSAFRAVGSFLCPFRRPLRDPYFYPLRWEVFFYGRVLVSVCSTRGVSRESDKKKARLRESAVKTLFKTDGKK